jgi:hypothetical protein
MESNYVVARIQVKDRNDLERQLGEAVLEATQEAQRHGRHGILVTRHGYGTLSVALTTAVPYGLTLECDQTTRC